MWTEHQSVNGVSSDWTKPLRDPVIPVQRAQIGGCFERQQWKQGNEADLMLREWFVGVCSQLQIRNVFIFIYIQHCIKEHLKTSVKMMKMCNHCCHDCI